MFKRLGNSWELVKASANILVADKELLLFPLMSGLALILVTASFFVPTFLFGASVSGLAEGVIGALGFVVLFLFYLSQYFVIIFFNTALVGAAMKRLDGGDPTLGDGLRIAWSRIGAILGYAAIAATVGLLLRALKERSGWLGRIVVSLIGVAWNLATYLVVPVLVVRGLGPIESIKESATILKRTWGEQIAGNVGLGFVFGLMFVGLALLAFPIMALAISTGQAVLIGMAAGALALAFLFVTLLSSALTGIYQAALYRFATTGQVGVGFDAGALRGAFT